MKWNEVKVTTESEAIEAVSNILMEAGASGVMIEDSLDIENYKTDTYGELLDKENYEMITEGAVVTAYFPETTSYLKSCQRFKRELRNWLNLV